MWAAVRGASSTAGEAWTAKPAGVDSSRTWTYGEIKQNTPLPVSYVVAYA